MRTKKFGSGKDDSRMLVRKMSRDFFLKGRLTTTVARAKALRSPIEHMVTLAKRNTEATKNVLLKKTGNKNLVAILTGQIAPVFSEKTSGFVRVVRIGSRPSDGSMMGRLEWTLPVVVTQKENKVKEKKEVKAKAVPASVKKAPAKKAKKVEKKK